MKKKAAKNVKWIKPLCFTLGAFLLTFLLIYTNLFYSWDKLAADRLCQTGAVPDERIFIVAIDDKTLEKYGPMNQWSRDIYRQVVEVLNQDPDTAPAVINFDIMYIEETDATVDTAFAKACAQAGNVVTAMNLQFREQPQYDENGKLFYNQFYINEVDYPFAALKKETAYGFANCVVDQDGYVRRAMLKAGYGDETIYSLAARTYLTYTERTGQEPVLPVLDKDFVYMTEVSMKFKMHFIKGAGFHYE